MPKAARVPKHRGAVVSAPKSKDKDEADKKAAAAAAASSAAPSIAVSSDKESALSRGQRKRQAKRDQYLKREKMIMASLRLKRADEQKKRIDGLDEIRDALLASVSAVNEQSKEDDETHKDNMLKSNKSRKTLVQREAAQMNLVLQHPRFQADPFGTLREHLQNTLAPDLKQQQKEAIKHIKEKEAKLAEKIANKKESGIKKKKKRFKAARSKSK